MLCWKEERVKITLWKNGCNGIDIQLIIEHRTPDTDVLCVTTRKREEANRPRTYIRRSYIEEMLLVSIPFLINQCLYINLISHRIISSGRNID